MATVISKETRTNEQNSDLCNLTCGWASVLFREYGKERVQISSIAHFLGIIGSLCSPAKAEE